MPDQGKFEMPEVPRRCSSCGKTTIMYRTPKSKHCAGCVYHHMGDRAVAAKAELYRMARKIGGVCEHGFLCFDRARVNMLVSYANMELNDELPMRPMEEIPLPGKKRIDRTDWYIPESCVRCGFKGIMEADHIVALEDGGLNCKDNMQLLCVQCHRTKKTWSKED